MDDHRPLLRPVDLFVAYAVGLATATTFLWVFGIIDGIWRSEMFSLRWGC